MGNEMVLRYTVDINAPLTTQMPVTLMRHGDDHAQTVEVTLMDGASAATLTDHTAVGMLLRSDGVKVRCPGTIDGGKITVPLVANCYIQDGPCELDVLLQKTGFVRTVLHVVGRITGDGDATVVDPTGSIPTYEDIAALQSDMEDAIDDCEAATAEATTKAALAETKAGLADSAATSATSAAASATTAAESATSAAGTASTAAGNADTKAALADEKAALAAQNAALAAAAAETASALRAPAQWSGTAITGTSATPAAYATGITDARVGDRYYYNGTDDGNRGNVYRCTQAGAADTALWAYDGNIRGTAGSGSVSSVCGENPDASGNVVLTAKDVGAAAASALAAHEAADSNPHGVTAAQVGAAPATALSAHAADTSNPHGVTAAQVGAATAAAGMPTGGTAGQALQKASGTDYDAEWATLLEHGKVLADNVSIANGGELAVTGASDYSVFAVCVLGAWVLVTKGATSFYQACHTYGTALHQQYGYIAISATGTVSHVVQWYMTVSNAGAIGFRTDYSAITSVIGIC